MAQYNNTDKTIEAIRSKFKIYYEVPVSVDDRKVQDIVGKAISVIREQPSVTLETQAVSLRRCPFCGQAASLHHDGLREDKGKTAINSYLITYWSVVCDNCGISKGKYPTEYQYTKSGNLVIIDGKDGKQKAIDAWNSRASAD